MGQKIYFKWLRIDFQRPKSNSLMPKIVSQMLKIESHTPKFDFIGKNKDISSKNNTLEFTLNTMSKTNVKKNLEFQGKKRQLLLSRKSMHLIRIEINDKKYALISTMKIKNALDLTMGGVGGGGGEEEMTNKSSLALGRTSAGSVWCFWLLYGTICPLSR